MVKNYEYTCDAVRNLKKRHAFDHTRRPVKRKSPNALERKLWKVLGPEFTYAGDGSFKIDNLSPDFVSKTRKIVVEAYGDYWHRNDTLEKTMQRVNRLERQGWRVLIIWENEIHDRTKLNRKLALL